MKIKPIYVISILGLLLSVLLCGIYFQFSYFEPDTVSYLFQAKLFAEGKISVPAPPEHGFSSSPHINVLNGKWYSKYPFGNALMLMFGVFINAPWLIPALATGGALLLLYLFVKEIYGNVHPGIALIAAVLALVSPATLGMGSTWFSEPVSRFYLSLYLLTLLRTLNCKDDASLLARIGYPLLSGFALGYAFNTRPLSAVVFGIVGAGLTVYHLFTQWFKVFNYRKSLEGSLTLDYLVTQWRHYNEMAQALLPTLKRLGFFFIPFVVMLGVCMSWNAHFTEDPFLFTHTVAQPYDKIGFGPRMEGYEPDLEQARIFTPAWAIERTWRHILPSISFNALGWGSYHHDLLEDIELSVTWFIAFVPLVLPWVLVLVPFFHRTRNRYDVFCLSLLIVNLLLYAFFYFEGSTWGFTPVNARYYTESTFLGFIPLAARGIFILYERFKPFQRRGLAIGVGICILLLSVNIVWSYVRIGKVYQSWDPVYQKLPPMVAERDIHNAVIFVPQRRDAPIGDYPFKNLQEADIVYFKLGPLPQWKLTNSDWQNVYAQYFTGRSAYLYDRSENSLTQLKQE